MRKRNWMGTKLDYNQKKKPKQWELCRGGRHVHRQRKRAKLEKLANNYEN